jgi:hypothetical protein
MQSPSFVCENRGQTFHNISKDIIAYFLRENSCFPEKNYILPDQQLARNRRQCYNDSAERRETGENPVRARRRKVLQSRCLTR